MVDKGLVTVRGFFEYSIELLTSNGSLETLALFLGVFSGLLALSLLVGQQMTKYSAPSLLASYISETERQEPPTSATETTAGKSTVEMVTPEHSRNSTDTQQIFELLEQADGQLRQSRIVSQTGWSKTKVSRTLTGMAEDEEVVKIKMGRENLICLPKQTPSIVREER